MAQSNAGASTEAQEARTSGNWVRALHRLVQRRQSLRSAAPFTAAIVAVAQSWIYTNGVLCHLQDRTLRVLDLHHSHTEETVVDIRYLWREALPEAVARRRFKFQLIYYAEGLVSCIYSHSRPDAESWLVVFDVQNQTVITKKSLESTYKLFVRNNAEYLYFGTHSEYGEDGFRRWVLMGYDIKANKWFNRKIHLMDMAGSDIGQSICFEIIDGHFYGLSNQTSFEVDEVDWTSYYHCFRFPASDPHPDATQRSVKDKMWRRQHAEGPIDDRWSFIRLIKNEEHGKLQILESRKEWLDRRSSGQRAYYTTDLHFAPRQESDLHKVDSSSEPGNNTGTANNSAINNASSSGNNGDDSSTGSSGGSSVGGHIILNPSGGLPSGLATRTNYYLPTRTETRPRDPFNTHIGDDASTALMFTFSKCPVRSYHFQSQTFLDLVDNPDPNNHANTPRLQLRAGARILRPAAEIPLFSPAYDQTLPHTERIKHIYKDQGANRIIFWPPHPDEADALRADAGDLDLLGKIVNPPTHTGNAKGVWDERSFVYSTGNNADGVQAIVFVGFDPSIRLQGLRRWNTKRETVEHNGPTAPDAQNKEQEDEEAAADRASCEDMHGAATIIGAEEACVEGKADYAHGEGDWVSTSEECVQYAYGAATATGEEQAQTETDEGKGKDTAVVTEPAAAAASASATAATATASAAESFEESSPESGYSSGNEDVVSCSSLDDLEPYSAIGAQSSGTCSWAWKEPAMYRKIAFGYDHLPDFTKAREDSFTTAA